MKRTLVVSLLVSVTALSVFNILPAHSQEPKIGSQVEIDPTQMGDWQTGTLKAIDRAHGNVYVVEIEDQYETREIRIPIDPRMTGGKARLRTPAGAPGAEAAADANQVPPGRQGGQNGAKGATGLNVGAHVQVDPTQMNDWVGGTITAIDKKHGNVYVVQLDEGREVRIPIDPAMTGHKSRIKAGEGPANAGGGQGAPAANPNGPLPGMPKMPPAANPAQAAPPDRAPLKANGPLSEEVVKKTIQREVATDQPGRTVTFDWRQVQIAAPRTVSNGEALYEDIPAGKQVYPVRVNYTQTKRYMQALPIIQDVVDTLLFYKDDFGNWVGRRYANSGNGVTEVQ